MAKASTDQLSLEEAYQAAFLWFDHKGEPPTNISEPAHGSVQLETEHTIARVRWSQTPAGQRAVLAILRTAVEHKKLAIFSASGFTPGAISVAETQGIALYSFDAWGVAHAETSHARSLAPATPPDPPFAPKQPERVGPAEIGIDFWSDRRPRPVEPEESTSQAAGTNPDDWEECSNCGTTHFRTAQFCRDCGTHLLTGTRHIVGSEPSELGLRCRACGSDDIVPAELDETIS
ncbi:MAG: hypothetical protein R2823_01185 [Acidimicrobiia bacterium]